LASCILILLAAALVGYFVKARRRRHSAGRAEADPEEDGVSRREEGEVSSE
jgi:hypothetical protein